MKVKKVKGMRCPECDEVIPEEELPELTTIYQCGECEEVYDDLDEAKECCRS